MQHLIPLLLFLSALPDAMVVPVLKDLLVDRYGVSRTEAQAFLLVNLIGAALAVGLVARLERRIGTMRLLAAASLVDALLLASLWLPLGWHGTIVVRALEGIPDAITFGLLMELLGNARGRSAASRLGLGSMVLLGGVGGGMGLGGLAAKLAGPGHEQVVFLLGAACSLIVAALAWRRSHRIADGPRRDPGLAHRDGATLAREPSAERRIVPSWVVLAMAFVDRATGGVLTGTLSLFLAAFFPYDAGERGWMIGLPLLAMALGAWPAGALAARLGSLRTRSVAAAIYATALGVLPFAGDSPWLLTGVLAAAGVAGAALLPTSLALELAVDRGPVGFTAFATAGGVGYACGTVLPVLVLGVAGDGAASYQAIIVGFAGLHAAVTCAAAASTRLRTVPTEGGAEA